MFKAIGVVIGLIIAGTGAAFYFGIAYAVTTIDGTSSGFDTACYVVAAACTVPTLIAGLGIGAAIALED